MRFLVNDRWRGEAVLPEPGPYVYSFLAWRDLFASWLRDTEKKIAAGVKISLEIEEGRRLVDDACVSEFRPGSVGRADFEAGIAEICKVSERLAAADEAERLEILLQPETLALMKRAGPRTNLTQYERELPVFADRYRRHLVQQPAGIRGPSLGDQCGGKLHDQAPRPFVHQQGDIEILPGILVFGKVEFSLSRVDITASVHRRKFL